MLYRFVFDRRLKMTDVEDALGVAYFAMRALHGAPAMRVDVSFSFNAQARSVVIDGRTDLGRDVAVVFEGLCEQMFERRDYGVQRTPVEVPTPLAPSFPFEASRPQRPPSRPRPQRRVFGQAA